MATPNQENRTVTEMLNARLHRVAARDDDPYSAAAVAKYCKAVDHVIFNRGYGHSLFRLRPNDLRKSGALIYYIQEDDQILTALHIQRHDSGQFAWINGIVKADGQQGSIVRDLMAYSMLSYEEEPLERVPFRACYRKFPAGFRDQFGKLRTKNDGSDKLFMSYAFEHIGTETVEVKERFSDAHLVDFCNPGTRYFDVHIVESTRRSIHMSKEYLKTAAQWIGIV